MLVTRIEKGNSVKIETGLGRTGLHAKKTNTKKE